MHTHTSNLILSFYYIVSFKANVENELHLIEIANNQTNKIQTCLHSAVNSSSSGRINGGKKKKKPPRN